MDKYFSLEVWKQKQHNMCLACEGNGFHLQPTPIYFPATHEMAMDAGDSNLAGEPVYVGDEYEQIPCQECNGLGYIKIS